MKLFQKISLIFALMCCFCMAVIGQKHSKHTAGKASSDTKAVCTVQSVPKGFVIVGYKPNAACAGGMELTVKRAESGDVICKGSPVPAGFSIFMTVQGAMAAACARTAYLIDDRPAVSVPTTPAAAAARCEAEGVRETDDLIRRGITNEALLLALRLSAESNCMKRAGQ